MGPTFRPGFRNGKGGTRKSCPAQLPLAGFNAVCLGKQALNLVFNHVLRHIAHHLVGYLAALEE